MPIRGKVKTNWNKSHMFSLVLLVQLLLFDLRVGWLSGLPVGLLLLVAEGVISWV